MMKTRHPFTLYARKLKGGVTYYYRLKDDPTRTGRSTGKTTKGEALAWMLERVKRGDDKTFGGYAAGFFDADSPWYRRQKAKGRHISPTYRSNLASALRMHLMPKWGKFWLSKINAVAFETWLVDLDLAPATKNHILYTMRSIMGEATREGIIPINPMTQVEPLRGTLRPRDAFTIDELARLFPIDYAESPWPDGNLELLGLIMATGGLRHGEILALTWADVVWNPGGLIVSKAWKPDGTIGTTKTGEARVVLLPNRTMARLKVEWEQRSAYTNISDRISYERSHKRFLWALRTAMGNAKVVPEGRRLDAHSLRHTYNTIMRERLPEDVLRRFMGHSSVAMTNHYDHPDLVRRLESMADKRELVETFPLR